MTQVSLNEFSATRLIWLDDAKMFAMLAVIVFHCIPMHLTGAGDVSDIIGSFNMQLFMFLAGFTAIKSLEQTTCWSKYWHYIVKITLHLLLPTFAIGLLRALITLDAAAIGNEQWYLKMLFKYLLVFATVNWLFAMLIRYIRRSTTNMSMEWILPFLKYVLFVVLMFFLSKTKLPEFPFYFLLGFFCRKYQMIEWFNSVRSCKMFWGLFVVVEAFIALLTWQTWLCSRAHNFYGEPFWVLYEQHSTIYYLYRQICGLGWIFLLLPLFILLSKRYTWFSYWGGNSLGLYITHTFLIHIVIEPLEITYIDNWTGWATMIVVVTLLTLASMLLVRLFSTNRYTRFIFLGQR